jgi:outer membrane protein assembly factor BamE (lipoprotein component of BamABCDE complex)
MAAGNALGQSPRAGFGDGLHMVGINRNAALLGALALVSGCSSIVDHRGYIADPVLLQSVHPGIDNRQSVEGTLGRPTFTSQFGDPVWYYVSSITRQKPFTSPRITEHTVLAVRFDKAGNVVSADKSGIDQVVRIKPESDKTPTLGRERGILQDLFGNIGQVGAGGVGGPNGSNTGGGGQ